MTKRRQSSTSEQSSKRPRLSQASGDEDTTGNPPLPTPDRSSEKRRSGQIEERKRGQRLFGALLGTLSQSSSSTAQKRRVDIEKKQQAKLKLQADEFDEKRKQRLEALMEVRREEQKKYNEQSVCLEIWLCDFLGFAEHFADANSSFESPSYSKLSPDQGRAQIGTLSAAVVHFPIPDRVL